MVAAQANDDELIAGTQILGRYSVVGKLAQGGMAEVYLARQLGPAGYHKLIVIKRVRPHLANDADFVGMFVNEARLAAMINHPNVVQIFDLGDEPRPENQGGGQDWFLAMEYLDGRDMLQIGRACRTLNKAVPFHVTARILADACAGLDHAHGLVGPDGTSLDLVHRDMSPENVLITFEGQVKVVDFGIAKASDNLIKTQAGQIKGKLGYVAPEAILGKPLDARADVFAVGATLYLFLAGRPAFSGGTPLEVFERSLKPPASPREVNPRVPEALDAICMKALAQDRDKRYRSAGEVRVALEDYIQSTGRPLGSVQLAQFMKILFPKETDPLRQRIDKMLADHPAELPRRGSPLGSSVPVPVTMSAAPMPVTVVEESEEDNDKTNIVYSEPMEPRPESVPAPIALQPATGRARPQPSPAPTSAAATSIDIDVQDGIDVHGSETNFDKTGEVDLAEVAAAIDDSIDGAAIAAHEPEVPPRAASLAARRSVIDDVAAALPSGYVGDAAPPSPFEASGATRRPPSAIPPPAAVFAAPAPPPSLSPPPSFSPPPFSPPPFSPPAVAPVALATPPMAAEPAAWGGDPPAWSGEASAAAVDVSVEAPPVGPSLRSKAAMLGFGALTGLAIVAMVLAASGQLGRLLGGSAS
jgi:serine/threonine protein kinase